MKIASAAGVLGEKIMIDSIFNCLVNDQGLADTNVEGDLKVEHQNLEFKTGLMNLAGKFENFLYRILNIEAKYLTFR